MTRMILKHDFLEELIRCNEEACRIVQTQFLSLDRAARSTQPEPNEWCVDQCFEHLVITFDTFSPQVSTALEQTAGTKEVEHFKPSWMAQRNFYQQMFNPDKKIKTSKSAMPSEHYYPDAFERFLAGKEKLAIMLEQAASADLQTRCWFLKITPINLGDYLEYLVRHDTLHIGQAQRALETYRQTI